MKYELSSNVPVPDTARVRQTKYPFARMKIGDSFHVPNDELMKIKRAAEAHTLRSGKTVRLVVREADDGTYRCWRID